MESSLTISIRIKVRCFWTLMLFSHPSAHAHVLLTQEVFPIAASQSDVEVQVLPNSFISQPSLPEVSSYPSSHWHVLLRQTELFIPNVQSSKEMHGLPTELTEQLKLSSLSS